MERSREETEQQRVGGGGRRLDPSRDAAIMRAALEGLAERGYDRLTMDDIAARARAGKGALYRRWPSKAALIIDAIAAWRDERGGLSIPDTGSLREDVEAIIAAVPEFDDTDRTQLAVFTGLTSAASRDPELGAAVSAGILDRPRGVVRQVLERAVERGEIARDRDISLVPDILIGLNMVRIVTNEPIDRAFVRRVFDEVVLPLVTVPASVAPSGGRRARARGRDRSSP